MRKLYKINKFEDYGSSYENKASSLTLLYQRNKKIVDNGSDLSPLESIVKYLKECLNFSFHKIASLLNRDDRTIYTTYSNCLKKKTQIVTKGEHTIPLFLFSNRELSVLEVAASYLREELGMTLKEISILVNKDPRT